MAKKQSRRSVSMSKGTYERLRAFCEVNQQSMSQFIEERIGDYLGKSKDKPAAAGNTDSRPVAKKTNDHIFTF